MINNAYLHNYIETKNIIFFLLIKNLTRLNKIVNFLSFGGFMPLRLLFGTFWKVLASFMFEIVPMNSNNGLVQIHAKPLLGKTILQLLFIHMILK